MFLHVQNTSRIQNKHLHAHFIYDVSRQVTDDQYSEVFDSIIPSPGSEIVYTVVIRHRDCDPQGWAKCKACTCPPTTAPTHARATAVSDASGSPLHGLEGATKVRHSMLGLALGGATFAFNNLFNTSTEPIALVRARKGV